jgi:hypothetical protein
MTNKPVILRLSNDDDSDVLLSVGNLSAFLSELNSAFDEVASVIAPFDRVMPESLRAKSNVDLLLAAPPRRACLELLFSPQFTLAFDLNVLIAQFPEIQRKQAEADIFDIASAGAAILELTTVLYRRWRERGTSPRAQTDIVAKLLAAMETRLASEVSVATRFERMRRAALQLGSSKVELSLSDEITIVISDGSDRSRAIVVGGNKLPVQGGLLPENKIQCISDAIDVVFKDQTYKAFCARSMTPSGLGSVPSLIEATNRSRSRKPWILVAVWASKNRVPLMNEEAVIQYEVIEDPDNVKLVGQAADIFAAADGAIFVRGSSGFQ